MIMMIRAEHDEDHDENEDDDAVMMMKINVIKKTLMTKIYEGLSSHHFTAVHEAH